MSFRLASVLFQEGKTEDIEEAERILDKLPQDNPDSLDILHLNGRIKHKLNKIDEAQEVFEKEVKICIAAKQQERPQTFFYLGLCHERKKDFKKCMQFFKKCLALDNNHFGGCVHLASLLSNMGEWDRAAKYFKHAMKIDSNSTAALFGYGKAMQMG